MEVGGKTGGTRLWKASLATLTMRLDLPVHASPTTTTLTSLLPAARHAPGERERVCVCVRVFKVGTMSRGG